MDRNQVRRDLSWIGARLREPSTYAGLAAVLSGLFHFANSAGWAAAIMSIGIGVGGIIAIVLPG